MTRESLDQVPQDFSQDPIEDREWDMFVLGRGDGLGSFSTKKDFDALSYLPALQPIAQILLSNRIGSHASYRADAEIARTRNPVLAAALETYESQIALPLAVAQEKAGYIWSPLRSIPLSSLDSHFDLFVSSLLRQSKVMFQFPPVSRLNLNALLFHPLQNASTHGLEGRPDLKARFAGISVQQLNQLPLAIPSVNTYVKTCGFQDTAFLEVVIHDDGMGVAGHYYNAHAPEGAPQLGELPIAREWFNLNLAIELHSSSKRSAVGRGYPRQRPGVGLYDLLERLRQLSGYLEIRTGRLRAYRWFMPTESLTDKHQLQPQGGSPQAASRLEGTVIRIFVPLVKLGLIAPQSP